MLRDVLDYLKPFPSTQGFSAARTPGPLVHVPVLGAFLYVGWVVCGVSPLLVVWGLAGHYVGRDLAILAHYGHPGCLAALPGWALLAIALVRPAWVTGMRAHFVESTVAPLVGTSVAGVLLVAWSVAFIRRRRAERDEQAIDARPQQEGSASEAPHSGGQAWGGGERPRQ